jgi:hypothetical protein
MHGLIDRGFAPLVWNRDRNKLTSLLKAGQRRLRAPPSGLAPDPTKIAEHF